MISNKRCLKLDALITDCHFLCPPLISDIADKYSCTHSTSHTCCGEILEYSVRVLVATVGVLEQKTVGVLEMTVENLENTVGVLLANRQFLEVAVEFLNTVDCWGS